MSTTTTNVAPLQRTIIDDFETMVMALITEVARYAADGPGPGGTVEDAEANIRRVRTLSAALNASIQNIQRPPPTWASPTRAQPATPASMTVDPATTSQQTVWS
ncbi:hypothetical protein QFZ99_006095 [Paraburkholderia atlantica]|uniref:hypothetical protein n=1 Tax=Paraburkholderia atlantica TaxID=2654982 RepID=UPI003D1A5AFE